MSFVAIVFARSRSLTTWSSLRAMNSSALSIGAGVSTVMPEGLSPAHIARGENVTDRPRASASVGSFARCAYSLLAAPWNTPVASRPIFLRRCGC